jgi:hypothetical protein
MAWKLLIHLICLSALAFVPWAASAAIITLDEATQGKGNKGILFRPSDGAGGYANFVMTARTMIDPAQPLVADAPGSVGTVYIDKDQEGAGVRTIDDDGSKGISGGGMHQDEELIFTYDVPIHLDSLLIGMANIDFGKGPGDKDEPVLFLSVAGSGGFGITLTELQIKAAFTFTGDGQGTIDLSKVTSLPGDTAIAAFKLRETLGHTSVLFVSTGILIPEPATMSLLVIGAVPLIGRRKLRRFMARRAPGAAKLILAAAIIAAVLMVCSAPAGADVVDPPVLTVSVQVSAGAGSGGASWVVPLDPGSGDCCNWYLPEPTTIFAGSNLLATVDSISLSVDGDPAVNLGFGVTAGAQDATFTITSAVVGFDPIVNPLAYAVASVMATDNNGNGAAYTGLFLSGKAYQARYNASNVAYNLVGTFPVPPNQFFVASERRPGIGYEIIPATIGSIQSQWYFKLTARDSASGTSRFDVIIPEPASLALLAIGAAALVRRRRR